MFDGQWNAHQLTETGCRRLPKDYAELLHIFLNHLNLVCNMTVDKSAGKPIRDRVPLEAKRELVQRNEYALDFQGQRLFQPFFQKIDWYCAKA